MNIKTKLIGIVFIITIIIICFIQVILKYYPVKYLEQIKRYSNEYNIDMDLVQSVIKVESGYNKEVISKKGAIGLMQIMPTTGEWISNKLGIMYKKENLSYPDINIQIGTWYLKYLYNRYEKSETALAAYNAGQGTVDKWLSDKRYSDDKKVLKYIPFKETRNYVKKIKISRIIYKEINKLYTKIKGR